jgi:hypothetical protein
MCMELATAPKTAVSPRPAATAPPPRGREMLRSLRPLAIDVGIPLGSYYLLRGLGASLWLSLVLSSIGPAVRSVMSMTGRSGINVLAGLMLAVNVAGIGVSFLTGDPRALIAKDSVISSVIGIAILASVVAGRPLMSAGLIPWLTKGVPGRVAAWHQLSAESARFRRLELLFSTIWGSALLADCVVRLIGAYTLPVTTMAWLGTVCTLGAIGLATMVGGIAAGPMERMVTAETARAAGRAGHYPAGTWSTKPRTSASRSGPSWPITSRVSAHYLAGNRRAAAALPRVQGVPIAGQISGPAAAGVAGAAPAHPAGPRAAG